MFYAKFAKSETTKAILESIETLITDKMTKGLCEVTFAFPESTTESIAQAIRHTLVSYGYTTKPNGTESIDIMWG